MADCFISYRRTPSAAVAVVLQAKLENDHKLDIYLDTTRTDSTKVRFPERLMNAIDRAPVFICLLGERDGEHTLQSEWVLKEIDRAYRQGKFCIPVFQESYYPLPNMPPAVSYLLDHDGVHIFDHKNVMIDASVDQLADLIKPQIKKRRPRLMLFLLVVIAIMAIGVVAAPPLLDAISGLNLFASGDVLPQSTATTTDTDTPIVTTTYTATNRPVATTRATITPDLNVSVNSSVCIQGNDVWLRSAPNFDNDIVLRVLSNGMKVKISGQPVEEAGEYNDTPFVQMWWPVSYNGTIGWIEERWLKDCPPDTPTNTWKPPTLTPSKTHTPAPMATYTPQPPPTNTPAPLPTSTPRSIIVTSPSLPTSTPAP